MNRVPNPCDLRQPTEQEARSDRAKRAWAKRKASKKKPAKKT